MQTVAQEFHNMAQNSVIPLDYDLRISFIKDYDDDVTFFILNTSVLNGLDILAPSDDNPIQSWDKYRYYDYKDRVIDMEWERKIDFPFSVQSAIADIKLNNYDDYFTPNSPSPLAPYVLPKRPMRLYAGFKTVQNIPQLVGLSQGIPEIDDKAKTASFHILDFLSEMFGMELSATIAMQNATTDVVLDAIFQQFGLLSSQYSLNKGRNKIPFLFFERGKNAGNAFRELMQAEMGKLWLDEQGIIRFEERLATPETSVMSFDSHNIIDIKNTGDDEIINSIKITSDIRRVQSFQPIFTSAREEGQEFVLSDGMFIVPANGTAFYPNASLEDPALSAEVPTNVRKNDDSWFTAVKTTGEEVLSNVSITFSELRTSSFMMLFENNNAFPVVIDQLQIWGEPAKVVDTIRYKAKDTDSVDKYGELILGGDEGIRNDFFGSYSNCDSFAEFVLDGYSEYADVIEMEVKGDPSLQLGDVIDLDYENYDGNYKVLSTKNKLADNCLYSTIRARRYTPRSWFVLDESLLNGTDVLAP